MMLNMPWCCISLSSPCLPGIALALATGQSNRTCPSFPDTRSVAALATTYLFRKPPGWCCGTSISAAHRREIADYWISEYRLGQRRRRNDG